MRCNLDVQDLRRVWPEATWLGEDERLSHVGDKPEWGYMNTYEWNGEGYDQRHRQGPTLGDQAPQQWVDI
jgi:hypothetical protein